MVSIYRIDCRDYPKQKYIHVFFSDSAYFILIDLQTCMKLRQRQKN